MLKIKKLISVSSLKRSYFWISMERIYIYADEIYLTSQIHICTELVGTKKDRMVSVLFRSMAAVNPMNSSSIPNHSCKSMVLQGRHSRGAMVASVSLLFNVIGASTSYTFKQHVHLSNTYFENKTRLNKLFSL